MTIRHWNIIISGYLQTEGKPTGMVGLWRKMRQYAASDTVVELRSWDQNWADLAELIWRMSTLDEIKPAIKIYGYSFGGYSATLLADELRRRGLTVDHMVLCDAVYRHSYFCGWWRCLTSWIKIRIPTNVKEVSWFRQRNPRWGFRGGKWYQGWSWFHPAGHDLRWDEAATAVHPAVELPMEHTYLDDSQLVHEKILDVAA